jgi:hypothetical protein
MSGHTPWRTIKAERARSDTIKAIAAGNRPRLAATVESDADYWLIRFPDLDLVTGAHTRGEIDYMGRDVVAITLEIPTDSFDVTFEDIEGEPIPED